MTKSLNDVEWRIFSLDELFSNYHGKRLTKDVRKEGDFPLLTASELNQGVSSFISNNEMRYYSNFISIDMFGHAFYHNYKASGDDNIYFFLNENISSRAKLFITACINKNTNKYSYGNQFRQNNADKDKILLPVNKSGEPDYEFMEEYIKEREHKLKEQYKQHIQQRINKLSEKITEKKEWKEYPISKIFDIKAGKRLTKANMTEGNIPFIGSTDSNNGITNFVKNENASTDKNVLGVNYNGSVVENFYHPYKCTFSDDVKRFTTKEVLGNKYLYLFLKNSILKQKCKYMYGYKFNENRMKKQRIMLPINESGEPDYMYMESYMKYLEQKKLLKYLDFINQK